MPIGHFKYYKKFPSKLITPRPVDVWLPDAGQNQQSKRYPVIYMHDGQNLFDPRTAFIGVDWGVHEAIDRLTKSHRIQPAIVVGIWSAAARGREYGPAKAILKHATDTERKKYLRDIGNPLSDDYLKFIVYELKPFIDETFPTLPAQSDTFIMGSSFGALISLYAVCEYPEVFFGAACLSTHWPAAKGAMIHYLDSYIPDPETHRIYFDYGTEAMDAQYEPYQLQADEVMRTSGYQHGVNWVTQKFPGEEHSERAWRRRVHVPLEFLLKR